MINVIKIRKKTGYKEDDILGGDDPYSASKASAEILFHSYFKNFLEKKNNRLKIATARWQCEVEIVKK